MPYQNDVPICEDYLYDFQEYRWYCNYFGRYQDSRLECKGCPYCRRAKENNNGLSNGI